MKCKKGVNSYYKVVNESKRLLLIRVVLTYIVLTQGITSLGILRFVKKSMFYLCKLLFVVALRFVY